MLSLRILWHIQETVERCIYSTGKELDLRNINGQMGEKETEGKANDVRTLGNAAEGADR